MKADRRGQGDGVRAAGVIHVNSPMAGLELQVPFGGFKCSSSGYREMGTSAIDFYTQIKTVCVDA